MPLGLNTELQSLLIENLADKLLEITIMNGVGVSESSRRLLQDLDKSLPGHGKVRDSLNTWISDNPLSDFVASYIDFDCMIDKFENEPDQKLTNLRRWENYQEKSREIIREFNELPYNYTVSTPAPIGLDAIFCSDNKHFEVSKDIRIVFSDKDFATQYPTTTGNELRDNRIWDRGGIASLFFPQNDPYEWKGLYIQIHKAGYFGRYGETTTQHLAISELKSFWGLQIALGIANRRHSWSKKPHPVRPIIHQIIDDQNLLVRRMELDPTTSALANDLAFQDWIPDSFPSDVRREFHQKQIARLGIIFNKGSEFSRIRLAASWLFDSYATDNELLSYVQAMVCLEIILGDASLIGEIGLGELLRNRCAYLIGKTSAQRAEILKDFKEIYDVRSHIVHRGKDRMSSRERIYHAKLTWYCRRCIEEELKLLEETERSKNP